MCSWQPTPVLRKREFSPVTCRLHGIDPYTYLADALQRVAAHPASRVADLTPRLWKQHFADSPMRSDLHLFYQ